MYIHTYVWGSWTWGAERDAQLIAGAESTKNAEKETGFPCFLELGEQYDKTSGLLRNVKSWHLSPHGFLRMIHRAYFENQSFSWKQVCVYIHI